jgi:predicted TPR repeat methyltransferase
MSDIHGQTPGREEESRHGAFAVTFPQVEADSVPQDEEYCLVRVDGRTRRIRFHDYHEIYEIPGLYEHIFYETLGCASPALMSRLLEHEALCAGRHMDSLTVLDVGAGNGIMGEALAEAGVETLVGVDILPEAARAAQRDRPGLYDAYYAVDLLEMPRSAAEALEMRAFDCLTLIAALGFGDIQPEAFTVAYNLVADGGFVAFNLRDRYLDGDDASGFAALVQSMLDQGRLEERIRARYVHRRSITGEALYYTGIVGRKRADIPDDARTPRRDN